MKVKKPPAYFATQEWTFESNENGRTWTHDNIQAAAAIDAAYTLRQISDTLQSILNRLDQLGGDGIHQVIRAHAKREAAARRRANLLAKAARAKRRAAKEAA